MVTIADVAKLAGVSQGTVSNVLNGKGNVTSEKIHAVKKAAQQLGYTINERARVLRKGRQDIIGVVLPTVEFLHYREIYKSIEFYAQNNGYSVQLFITSDNPQIELKMLRQAKSAMIQCMAVVSCLKGKQCAQAYAEFEKVCYLERRPDPEGRYFGFDYRQIGADIAGRLREKGCKDAVLLAGSEDFWNEAAFRAGFFAALDGAASVRAVTTDMLTISHRALEILLAGRPEAVVASNIGFAKQLRQIRDTFFPDCAVEIWTLAPLAPIEEDGLRRYALNYSLLGEAAARSMISDSAAAGEARLFPAEGPSAWNIAVRTPAGRRELNMLTLESPELNVVRGLAQAYSRRSGIEVNVISASYEELYEQLANAEYSDVFDVFRLDVAWLSWFADKVLLPLEQIEPGIRGELNAYIPAIVDRYCMVGEQVYALPLTPSPQMLFYRKDLFENLENRRLYYEQYGRELRPPETFGEYNAIAGFFTRPGRPGIYGNTLTTGNSALAATEFLARYFSHTDRLYDAEGRIALSGEVGRMSLAEMLQAQKYALPGPSRWWTDTVKAFAAGGAAMTIIFANYTSEILRADSEIIGSIGWATVPGGNPICGGGTVGVARNSRAPREALDFIRWLTVPPASSFMAALGSVSPCEGDYRPGETVRRFPWMEMSKQCLSASTARKGPGRPGEPFNERLFDNIVGTAVRNVMAGLAPIDKALELAQSRLEREI